MGKLSPIKKKLDKLSIYNIKIWCNARKYFYLLSSKSDEISMYSITWDLYNEKKSTIKAEWVRDNIQRQLEQLIQYQETEDGTYLDNGLTWDTTTEGDRYWGEIHTDGPTEESREKIANMISYLESLI